MFGLTYLGIFHTLISLVALGSGATVLFQEKRISFATFVGKIYIFTTIITCLTGFGIYQHGGFGVAHILGIVTLLVLGFAIYVEIGNQPFGAISAYIEAIAYSFTFFLHLIPGVNETLSRLPLDNPIATGPDDPKVKMAIGVCFVLFLNGVILQVIMIKNKLKNKS
ncbi:MAG: hypothetical protein SFY32_13645 [Bacteroidota bacterium]|nr:hypothetical protein [Bacteroidota bacterium]